jgi:KDO2-lipid IV(A) lauroyltransferase
MLYILLYRVLGYRKEVVHTNLIISFPEKSAEDIQEITKKYYRNLSDSIDDTIKI